MRELALRTTATASSENFWGVFPATGVNNGTRETSYSQFYWLDDTPNAYPDWVQIEWRAPVTINRLIVRLPVVQGNGSLSEYTIARSRVQYWDGGASAWRDVVGEPDQPNPIVDWLTGIIMMDGRESRIFDFDPLTTTKVRVLVEDGDSNGNSWLEEIEAYDCPTPDPPETQCTNLALTENGGEASASSVHWYGDWPAAGVNNGIRDRGTGYWNDGTFSEGPDWVQVAWRAPTTINRLLLRLPVVGPGYPVGEFTIADSRVQYYDDARSTWRDVVGQIDQPNPILDWTTAVYRANGLESRWFDFPAITTTKVRYLVDVGATTGFSWLDEIEAYEIDEGCDGGRPAARNLALPANGGEAIASSVHSSGTYPIAGVHNGRVENGPSGYWNDGTNGTWPDWAGIEWSAPVTLDHIVATIPIARPGYPVGERTLERSRVQYWDDGASAWRDVVGRSGQDNPILDWEGPITTPDGSESRRFDVGTLTTSRIRVLIEEGSTDGWSWLAEIEAWGWD